MEVRDLERQNLQHLSAFLSKFGEIWLSAQIPNSESRIRVTIGKNKELNSWQRGGDYFKSGNKMTRQINGFSEGGGSLALCVLHGAARRAESLLTRRAGV